METKTNTKSQLNEGLKVGAGAVVGAVVGVAGTMAAEPLFAAQASETPEFSSTLEDVEVLTSAEQVEESIEPTPAPQVREVDRVEITVNGSSYNVADVNQDGSVSVDVDVIEYPSDVEVLSEDQALLSATADALIQGEVIMDPSNVEVQIDGTTFLFADINEDGIADLAAVDLNQDGLVSNDEVVDVRSESFYMSDLANIQPDTYTNDLAYNEEVGMPDYVNDADVNEFMA